MIRKEYNHSFYLFFQKCLSKNKKETYFSLMLERYLAGDQIGLINALLVISPFPVPNVFVFQSLHKSWFFFVFKPKLAIRFHLWFNSINHSENPDCWTYSAKFSDVVIGTVELINKCKKKF